jgi:chromate reductase
MSEVHQVAVLVGSLRKESFNRNIARALVDLAPPILKLSIVEIGQLSMYNQDLDATPPAEWTKFRSQIKAADAVLFVTAEYNRSVPGALKNAIDIGSRPFGQSVWNGKPGAVVSSSLGGNRRVRRQSSSSPVIGVPERVDHATARGLYRRRAATI